jgi:hypothetical protein
VGLTSAARPNPPTAIANSQGPSGSAWPVRPYRAWLASPDSDRYFKALMQRLSGGRLARRYPGFPSAKCRYRPVRGHQAARVHVGLGDTASTSGTNRSVLRSTFSATFSQLMGLKALTPLDRSNGAPQKIYAASQQWQICIAWRCPSSGARGGRINPCHSARPRNARHP